MSEPIPHRIRRMEPADLNFVLETTLKVRQPRGLSWREWEGLRREETKRDLSTSRVLVAEADGVLLGFSITDGIVVSMLYVKRDFRGDGIGVALLHEATGDGTSVVANHPTASWRAWTKRRGIQWTQVERKAAA